MTGSDDCDPIGSGSDDHDPTGSDFDDHDPTGSDFDDRDTTGSDFDDHDPTGSDFDDRDPTGSDFDDHDATGSDFDDHDATGSDFDDRDPTVPDIDDSTDSARRTTAAPDTDDRFAVPLRGVAVDPESRCAHWDETVDVVALRFGCCEGFYPCVQCHDVTADHGAVPWPRDRFDEPAVLCGGCGATLTPPAYFACDDACPECGAAFNPGCRAHRDRYFES